MVRKIEFIVLVLHPVLEKGILKGKLTSCDILLIVEGLGKWVNLSTQHFIFLCIKLNLIVDKSWLTL